MCDLFWLGQAAFDITSFFVIVIVIVIVHIAHIAYTAFPRIANPTSHFLFTIFNFSIPVHIIRFQPNSLLLEILNVHETPIYFHTFTHNL